mgnify:CR=1 FL=1
MSHSIRNPNTVQILHLSMHGSKEDVLLGGSHPVPWTTLAGFVGLVKVATGDRLLLSMSSCEGYYGIQMATLLDEPPFFGLVGPTDTVAWEDSWMAFAAYYEEITKDSATFNSAVDKMNSVGIEKLTFKYKLGADAFSDHLVSMKSAPVDQTRWLAQLKKAQNTRDAALRAFVDELQKLTPSSPPPAQG